MKNRFLFISLLGLCLLLSGCFDKGQQSSTHYVFGGLEGAIRYTKDKTVVEMVHVSEDAMIIEQDGTTYTEGSTPFETFLTKWQARGDKGIVAAMTYNFEETGFDTTFAMLTNPRFDAKKEIFRFDMQEVPANYDRLKVTRLPNKEVIPMNNVSVFFEDAL